MLPQNNKRIGFWLIVFLVFSFFLVSSAQAQQKTIKLSPAGKKAINDLAKTILIQGNNPKITALKPQLDPQDYKTVKDIGLLPDNPLYLFKQAGREIRVLFTFDQVKKTYQRLFDGNEKTVESLLVLEKAVKQKNRIGQQRLVGIAAGTLDSVGRDFDVVANILDALRIQKDPQAAVIQQEAFRFVGYYLKHQVLLQQQEDNLNAQDFLTVESVRVKHLSGVAHIVVSENREPSIVGRQLAQFISPQVGSTYKNLATVAILRDLEANASLQEQQALRNAQEVLLQEFSTKLTKLPLKDRLKEIERYVAIIHGNPIREFQAYNRLGKSFASLFMTTLKDKAAQNFKLFLNSLSNETVQQQFVDTLISIDPIDLRLLAYTEIQLNKDKSASNREKSKKATIELERLQQIKNILKPRVCTLAKDPKALINTRFYTQAITTPDILDIRVAQFLTSSIKDCNLKDPNAIILIGGLQQKIQTAYASRANQTVKKSTPSSTQAKKIVSEENIQVKSEDKQQVAEQVQEEIAQIEEELSENPSVLEREAETVVEDTSLQKKVESLQEEILSDEPQQEEIVEKSEEIIEEIVDTPTGDTSPLVEELPLAVQEEIKKETAAVVATPTSIPTNNTTSTPVPASIPPPAPTTILEPVVTTVQKQTETVAPLATQTPVPTVAVPGL